MPSNLEQYAATRAPVPPYEPSVPFYLLKDAARDKIISDVDAADVLTLASFSTLFLNLAIREASSVAEIINILHQALARLLITTDQEISDLHEEHQSSEFLTDHSRPGRPGVFASNEQEIVDSMYEIDPADEKISTSSSTTSDPDSLRKTFAQKWRTILEWLEK